MKKEYFNGVIVLAGQVEPKSDIGTLNRFYLLPVPWTHLELTRAIRYVADLNRQKLSHKNQIDFYHLLEHDPDWQKAIDKGMGLRAWVIMGINSWTLLEILDKGWKGQNYHSKAIHFINELARAEPAI